MIAQLFRTIPLLRNEMDTERQKGYTDGHQGFLCNMIIKYI